jgi:hypothetical protein
MGFRDELLVVQIAMIGAVDFQEISELFQGMGLTVVFR